MNWKGLGQIALMLVIVVPIGLGYMLAFHNEQVTVYEQGERSNLSDDIMNHTSSYYTDYTGSTNDSTLYNRLLAQGTWYTQQNSPEYYSSGTKQTQLPIYEYSSASLYINSGSYTYTAQSNGEIVGSHYYGNPSSFSTATYTTYKYPYFTAAHSYSLNQLYLYDSSGSLITMVYPGSGTAVTFVQTSGIPGATETTSTITSSAAWTASLYTVSYTNSYGTYTYTDVCTWYWPMYQSNTLTVNWAGATTVSTSTPAYIYSAYNLAVGPSSISSVSDYSGEWTYIDTGAAYWDSNEIIYSGGSVWLDSGDVVWVIPILNTHYVNYWRQIQTSNYGDPQYGWRIIDTTDQSGYQSIINYWTNNHVNHSVTFYANLDVGEFLGMYPTDSLSTNTTVELSVFRSGNTTYVSNSGSQSTSDSAALGTYKYVMITIDEDSYTVSGLASWPSVYGTPSPQNTLTLDRQSTGDFNYVKITTPYLSSSQDHYVWLRVDKATVKQGEYSTTKDYTYDISAKFPGKGLAIKMNSIQVYGDSLTVAGTTYTITEGRITINDLSYPLKGSLWSWIYNQDTATYALKFNEVDLAENLSLASLTFNGEWSTIITGYTLTETSKIETQWLSGQFALDKQGFAGQGVLAQCAAFLVLGLTGRQSVPKAQILQLILGGQSVVYLIIL